MRLEIEMPQTASPLAGTANLDDAFFSTAPDLESLVKKGIAAAQSGDREQARKLLSQATAIDPASEDAWLWLASISEYPEELLAFLNRVLEINPENERACEWRVATKAVLAKTFVQRAATAWENGDSDLARQFLDHALAQDNDCESAWFGKAQFAESDDQKIEFFERVLEISPENHEASDAVAAISRARIEAAFDAAHSAAAAGDNTKAFEILDKLTNNDSESIRETAWFVKATLAESSEQKLEFFDQVLNINPSNQEAANAIAEIQQAKLQAAFDEAQAKLQAAFNEAKEAAAAGNRKKAVEILDEFLADAHDSVEGWLLKSHLSNSVDEKIDALEKALELDPDNAAARSGLEFLSLTFGATKEGSPSPVAETDEDAAEPSESGISFTEDQETAAPEYSLPETDDDDAFAGQPTEETITFQETPTGYETMTIADELNPAPEFVYEKTDQDMGNFDEAVQEFADEFNSSESHASDSTNGLWSEDAPESTQYDLEAPPPRPTDDFFSPTAAPVQLESAPAESLWPFDQKGSDDDEGIATQYHAPTDTSYDVNANDFSVSEHGSTESYEHVAEDHDVDHFAAEMPQMDEPVAASTFTCSFCHSENELQAFECTSCHATLTLSDIESLLSNTRANHEVIQHAVTQMEAEWNLREFTEHELTALGIGHFNLNNFAAGFKYLQEASRSNPNNVMLAGQVNTLAIRLDEISRQTENYDARAVGKTILVVDDSPTVRKLIAGKLEKSGHKVVCAVDGVDALARLSEGLPDLVLLDITMPRMDGYEVCKQIRANPDAQNLPVVMISGKDGFFDKVRGRMAGSTGYVTKPFGPETLMKALETYLLTEYVEVA